MYLTHRNNIWILYNLTYCICRSYLTQFWLKCFADIEMIKIHMPQMPCYTTQSEAGFKQTAQGDLQHLASSFYLYLCPSL